MPEEFVNAVFAACEWALRLFLWGVVCVAIGAAAGFAIFILT